MINMNITLTKDEILLLMDILNDKVNDYYEPHCNGHIDELTGEFSIINKNTEENQYKLDIVYSLIDKFDAPILDKWEKE